MRYSRLLIGLAGVLVIALLLVALPVSSLTHPKGVDLAHAPYKVVIHTPYREPAEIVAYCPDGGWQVNPLTCCITFTAYYTWDAAARRFVYSEDRRVYCGGIITMVRVTDTRTGKATTVL